MPSNKEMKELSAEEKKFKPKRKLVLEIESLEGLRRYGLWTTVVAKDAEPEELH